MIQPTTLDTFSDSYQTSQPPPLLIILSLGHKYVCCALALELVKLPGLDCCSAALLWVRSPASWPFPVLPSLLLCSLARFLPPCLTHKQALTPSHQSAVLRWSPCSHCRYNLATGQLCWQAANAYLTPPFTLSSPA